MSNDAINTGKAASYSGSASRRSPFVRGARIMVALAIAVFSATAGSPAATLAEATVGRAAGVSAEPTPWATSLPARDAGPAGRVLDSPRLAAGPQQARGRGDDLARIRRWRSFLDRAHRAFFAAHMSTAAVKAKISQADERIDELEDAPAGDRGGRSDITGDVGFLERAQRAFTAAHMNTEAVQRWLTEAKEGG